jgi:nucleoside-diphosphate-sugar epimerase
MILVTGASGLTGQFVVEELLRRGHAVRVLRRTPAMSSSVEVDDRAVRHRRSVDIHRPVRRAPSVTRCYQHDHDTDSHARIQGESTIVVNRESVCVRRMR